jgi:hypothetical protein
LLEKAATPFLGYISAMNVTFPTPIPLDAQVELADKLTSGKHEDLRLLVLDAAAEIGLDGSGKEGLLGYLKYAATAYPKQYMALLSKVMPLQIDSRSTVNVIEHVNIVSVPSDRYMPPKVIEHSPQEIVKAVEVQDPSLMTIEDVLKNPTPVDLAKDDLAKDG